MKRTFASLASLLFCLFVMVSTVLAFSIGNVDGVWGVIPGNVSNYTVVDMVGVIGENPPAGYWQSPTDPPGQTKTKEGHLYRRNTVCIGDSDGDTDLTEWIGEPLLPSPRDHYHPNLGLYTPSAACANVYNDLIISEYSERWEIGLYYGYIELYNGTANPINLSNYLLEIYENGSTSATQRHQLVGTIPSKSTFVISRYYHYTRDGYTWISVNNIFNNVSLPTNLSLNGNDAVALVKRTNYPGADCLHYAIGPGNLLTGASILPSIQDLSNIDENQFRYGSLSSWGNCGTRLTDYARQTGVGFDGVDLVGSIPFNVPFLLGNITHYNYPVIITTGVSTVPFSVKVKDFRCEDGTLATPSELTLNYTIRLDDTVNTLPVCPYLPGDPVNAKGCADALFITQTPATSTFSCRQQDGTMKNYVVAILGFLKNPPVTQAVANPAIKGALITAEGAATTAGLYASISEIAPSAVALNFFEVTPTQAGMELAWQTAFETDNIGFNIYRSEGLEFADAIKLNGGLIESLVPPGSTFGSDYSFLDSSAGFYRTYYYWLEDIDVNGTVTLHGPFTGELVD